MEGMEGRAREEKKGKGVELRDWREWKGEEDGRKGTHPDFNLD